VLATLRERSDKKSRAMVERAVDVATRVSSDFRALLAGQVARAAERADKLSPSQRLALVRWSCLITPRLDLAADAATFAKTAKACGRVARRERDGRRPRRRERRRLPVPRHDPPRRQGSRTRSSRSSAARTTRAP
jgi:hypothetical protein